MQRRTALIKLGLVTGGIFLLPSCNFSEEKSAKVIKYFQIDQSQEEFLRDYVATIIPKDKFPGAGDLKIENFVWIMLKDTFDKTAQISFLKGLSQFNKRIEDEFSKTFTELSSEEKLTSLNKIDGEIIKDGSEAIRFFMQISKKLTIQGYLQSQYIMTEVMPYQLVPGGHGNCENVSEEKRINIYG